MKKYFFLFTFIWGVGLGLTSCKKDTCNGGDQNACVCPAVIDPVCGCDGITYENDCRAACAEVDVEYTGPCQ